MSWIRRFFETLQYVPGYYRVFFLYISVIVMVFLYVVFFHNKPLVFVAAAMTVLYSGIGVPIVVQSVVGKLSRSMGWWASTALVLIGLYILLRFLVSYELLDARMYDPGGQLSFSGLVYWANIYGIVWSAALAGAAVVNMALHHGIWGVRENIRRDIHEIRMSRSLTKGEPLVLDRRTIALVLMGIAFTGGILVLRASLVVRPDLVTEYTVPNEIFRETPRTLTLMLTNNAKDAVDLFTVEFTGYFRYPAQNLTGEDLGKDMLATAKRLEIVRTAYEKASEAPADLVVTKVTSEVMNNIREIFIDFTEAYSHLGLYANETARQQIPSKFIVQWNTKDKRLQAVWVGTPGIPFLRILNATRLDGRGLVESEEAYREILIDGGIEMKNVSPGAAYGFNLSGVYYDWLGAEFVNVDSFFVASEATLDDGDPRRLVSVEVRLADEG